MRFGEILRVERKRAGLTQRVVASHLRVTESYVSDVERGTRPPLSATRIAQFADLAGSTSEVITAMLMSNQSERRRIFLDVPTSHIGQQVCVALMSRWPQMTDDKFRSLLESLIG